MPSAELGRSIVYFFCRKTALSDTWRKVFFCFVRQFAPTKYFFFFFMNVGCHRTPQAMTWHSIAAVPLASRFYQKDVLVLR